MTRLHYVSPFRKALLAITISTTLAVPAIAFALGAMAPSGAHAASSSGDGGSGAVAGPARPSSISLVISQVYGGGGNTGAPWRNDFIELFNPTGSGVDVTGWSVQYASSGGTTWQITPLNGVIPAGAYYLIQEGGGTNGQPLPAPDATGAINMSSAQGKVALVNNTTALTCGVAGNRCLPNSAIIDFVGFGTAAQDWEGSGPTGTLSNTTSAARFSAGCLDNDDNATDFEVTATIDPRNSSSPTHSCGQVTTTVTATSGAVTGTPTLTGTPGPQSSVLIYMLHYTQYFPATLGDEAVRLVNTTGSTADVAGWQISASSGTITLPAGAAIPAGRKIWIANLATTFSSLFGFSPDYEYGGDTDPAVPQAVASPGFNFPDAGDGIRLLNASGGGEDTLVYKNGSVSTQGWSGVSVRPYLPAGQPDFQEAGQILYRKLDQTSGRPVADTNTKDDWAQDDDPSGASPTPGREYDDVTAKKLLRPGWALTTNDNEDLYFTKLYTETNVTTKFLVDPDNSFDAIRNMILTATQSIQIETYEWHNAAWVQDIIDAHNRGVQVQIAIEGNPCCLVPPKPDDETLWSAKQWEDAGIPVYFFSGYPGTTDDNYRYNNVHAKIMVVDHQWVITGSDNFAFSSMPNDNKANGTAGARGAMVITNAPDVVSYTLRLMDFDFQPARYLDLVRYPGLGTPPPGYTPTPLGDLVGYTPVKPTPLIVTENETFEIVQSPDNALRDEGSLIGLVNRAGPGDMVMVEQQYERKFWESSTTDGPNPRLEAYIRAARRGANVRILLDGFFEGGDCTSSTHNPATVAYVNGLGLPNLQARVGEPVSGYPLPTGTPVSSPTPDRGNIHAKIVLVSTGGGLQGNVHISSINGSLNSSKNNREYGVQVQSTAAFNYYKDVFDVDWARGYLPCGAVTPTPTVSGTPATATPIPSPVCNLLTNPDFETGQLSPWVTTTPGIVATVVASPVAGGQYAAAVTSSFISSNGGSQGIQQNLDNITAGATYRVAAAVLRSAANIASARIRITWYPCAAQSCAGTNQDMFLGSNSADWQYITANMTAPAGTLSARFKPVFYTSDGQPATIYFDNLSFECTDGGSTPTSTSTPGGPTLTATYSATPGGPTVTVTPTITGTPALAIGTVQGSGLRSPYLGQVVTVQGIVTVIKNNGFFIQDGGDGNANTSDGVFVFTSSFPSTVAPGQLVRVRATVVEFQATTRPCDLTLTELSSPTVTQLGSGALPTPVVVNDVPEDRIIYPNAVDFYERYEGMVVQVQSAVVVGGTNPAFGEFWVLAGGDTVPGSGYLGNGHIFVHPTAVADVDYNSTLR